MKIFNKQQILVLLGLTLPLIASAHVMENADYMPGFFGHPLIKSTGYKAESGRFAIELGQSLKDLENMTDDNYSNYTTAISILGATVAYDERVRVVPEDVANAKPIEPGKSVGFVVSPGSNDVSVLNLSVAKVVAINLLDKDGEIIKSLASGGDDNFNVLNLNLVNVAIDGMVKVVAQIPLDINKDVYGISLSTGGVDANVGHDLKIHYAFIDDFERVPIIKKYYPNATGEIAGMATGGKKLVNNNLKDGAATAILTIGGTYYTVMTNSRDENGNLVPFPHGVEAGWVMSSGSVLNLEAGGAIQIIGIRTDGSEYIISTNVNVVGLKLLGGGDTVIPFMTPIDPEIDLIGFKLNRINVLSADLGATLVNYAYIKVPETLVPPLDVPFEAHIEVVPGSEIAIDNSALTDDAGYPGDGVFRSRLPNERYIENDYQNKIYVLNDGENPLRIPTEAKSNDGPWTYHSDGGGFNDFLFSFDNHRLQLGVSRTPIKKNGYGEPEVVGYYDIVYTGKDVPSGQFVLIWIPNTDLRGNTLKDNTLYFKFSRQSNTSIGQLGTYWFDGLTYDENGVIDLTPLNNWLNIIDGKISQEIHNRGDDSDGENVIGYEYTLYYIKDQQAGSNSQMLSAGIDIDVASVKIPDYTVQWELAGTINNIDNDNNIYNHNNETMNAYTGSDGAWSDVKLANNEEYRHYVSFTVPDRVDEKSDVNSVTLFRYWFKENGNALVREPLVTYKRNVAELDGKRESVYVIDTRYSSEYSNDNLLIGQVYSNGMAKVVFRIEDRNEVNSDKSANMYGLELNLNLDDDFVTTLAKRILRKDDADESDMEVNAKKSEILASSPNQVYGWYWTGAPGSYTLPELSLKKENISSTSYLGPNHDQTVVTAKWDIDLGDDCKVGHLPQITNGWYNRPETNIYNIDILFNQWSTLRYDDAETQVNSRKPGMLRALLDGYVETTDQNVVLNVAEADGNEIDGQYDVENATTSDYIMTSQVTYPNEMIYRPSTQYEVTTRAYVPVVPDGFQTKGLSDDVQTYLALEKTETVLIYGISTTGVENVVSDDANAPAEYFNLQGVRIEQPEQGIYIVRRGNKVAKEFIMK